MRAVQFLKGEFAVVDDAPEPPPPGPGQLLVRVDACGVCGSDLSVVKDPERFVGVARSAGYPLACFDTERPVVLGHEFAGTLLRTGPGVSGFAEGDAVTGIGVVTDPSDGVPTIIGYSNDYPGGFGERITVDAHWARHVPAGLAPEHAALAEPLHVGETHVQQSGLTGADAALVIGCGPIGLGVIAAARAHGARAVVAAEPSPMRRRLAAALGADLVVDPGEQDPVSAWQELDSARGDGVLIAFECSGRQGMIGDLLRTLPPGSRIQMPAAPFADETIVPVIGQLRRISLNFGHGPTEGAYDAVLGRIADGSIDAESLITDRIGLAGVPEAVAALTHPDRQVKTTVLARRSVG